MVSVRRVAPVLLLVIATTAFAQKQSSTPPRDLHRVGDHWTAYNPPDPATYPVGARTHEIKSGDTLWALAQQYLNDPYLWPQLWESNTWVTDAHWIYPGDVLLIGGEGTAAAAASEPEAIADTSAFAPTETEDGSAVGRVDLGGNPIALATESDIYCYGYIGDPDEPMPNVISSHEDTELKYLARATKEAPASAATGDLVYVTGGAETGLVAGETYLAVEPGELVLHPETGEVIGRQYDYVGQVRVLCTEEGRSRAMVTQSCREVTIGSRLKPIPQLPIPIARVPEMAGWCDPPTNRSTGYIVDSRGWDLGLAEGNLVQVNLGREDALEPGDFLTVFRPSTRDDQPRVVLGEVGILTTEARTATGIIMRAQREIVVGDQVERR